MRYTARPGRGRPDPHTMVVCDGCGAEARCPDPTDLPLGWAATLLRSGIEHRCAGCDLPPCTLNLHPPGHGRAHPHGSTILWPTQSV